MKLTDAADAITVSACSTGAASSRCALRPKQILYIELLIHTHTH
jgi:hypothetical protein